jgi:hypothetical protein
MDTNLKYAFNLPWRGVVVFTGFYAGLAIFIAHKAEEFTGVIFVCLVALSLMFTFVACIMMTRRFFFPRVLELSEDALLFPRGFPRTRIIRIHYMDIIRWDGSTAGQSGFSLITGKGRFEIGPAYFPNIADYDSVRDFIRSKLSAAIPLRVEGGASERKTRREFYEPILSWREPDDWARYRTFLFTSKPLFSRLARALWFCVRCFGIIMLPWFVLFLCGMPTSPAVEYVLLALAVSFFFTSLHWLRAKHPVHATEICFRDNGISQFFGIQTMDHNYGLFSGWEIVERQFEGRVLPILLMRWPYGVRAFALPDKIIHDRLVQIFHEKKIPQIPDLRPSWE